MYGSDHKGIVKAIKYLPLSVSLTSVSEIHICIMLKSYDRESVLGQWNGDQTQKRCVMVSVWSCSPIVTCVDVNL